jgi:hypothetical protein
MAINAARHRNAIAGLSVRVVQGPRFLRDVHAARYHIRMLVALLQPRIASYLAFSRAEEKSPDLSPPLLVPYSQGEGIKPA